MLIAPRTCASVPCKLDYNRVPSNLKASLNANRNSEPYTVIIDDIVAEIDTVGCISYRLADLLFRKVKQLRHACTQNTNRIFVDQLAHTFDTDLARGKLRPHIAKRHFGRANIQSDNAEKEFVGLTFFEEMHARYA